MRLLSRFLKPGSFFAAVAMMTVPALAQTPVVDNPDKPAPKHVRSIPYVSIVANDGKQRSYETNAIPLLFNRACFGWRMYLGGPNRSVALTEVLTTSQPAEQVIAGPETVVSPDKTRATTTMRETVQDDISIDGEPRGEFVFCAIEIPDQSADVDPRDLHCPNKFNSVEREPRRPLVRRAS